MKDNVLFAYHDVAVIKEFCEMMQQFDFSIDTAENGLDAAELLKSQEYKVVITGIDLEVFNGIKILGYLNRRHPNTVCIVYTSRMDLGRLKFLVNRRDVFRIFLWPANYHGEFYRAITEGFGYYNLRCARQEEKSRNEKKHDEYRRAVEDLKKLTGRKQENIREMGLFMLPVIRMAVSKFSGHLGQYEQEQVMKYEKNIFSYYIGEGYLPCASLDEMKHFLVEEICGVDNGRKLAFHFGTTRMELGTVFFEDARFLIWLILNRYLTVAKTYSADIRVSFAGIDYADLKVSLSLPAGAMEQHDAQPRSILLTNLMVEIAQEIAGKVEVRIEEEKIVYHIELAIHKNLTIMEEELGIGTLSD